MNSYMNSYMNSWWTIYEFIYDFIYYFIYQFIYEFICEFMMDDTGWRRLMGSRKLQIIFHKRATKYRSLLRKMTYKDKGSYESSPPCTWIHIWIHTAMPWTRYEFIYEFIFEFIFEFTLQCLGRDTNSYMGRYPMNAAQEWTNRTLAVHELTSVHFLILPGSLLSNTEITEYRYFSPWKPIRELICQSE